MGISLNLDSWQLSKGYIWKLGEVKGRGTIHSIVPEYDVYLRVDLRYKEFGIQIDRRWKTYYLGRLYGVQIQHIVRQYQTERKTRTSSGGIYFSEFEGTLGGEKETLG